MRHLPVNIKSDLLAFLSSDPAAPTRPTLQPATLDWFRANKDLSMTRPRELYRGLFLTGPIGNTTPKPGDEGKMISFPQPTCSSWSSVLGVARRFALNSKELVFPRMRAEFLRKTKPSDGVTGVVITALITPEDVVCDVDRVLRTFGISSDFGTEHEYILKPKPSLTARIINVYTYAVLAKPISSVSLWGPAEYAFYDNTLEFPGGA